MKRILLSTLIVSLVLLPMGCDLDIESMIKNVIGEMVEGLAATYTIKVISGVGVNATGLNVTGEYMVVHMEFDPDTDTMEFISESFSVTLTEIPEGDYIEYTFTDAIAASAMFQKRTDDETLLRVEIWRGADLIDWEETTQPWGAVLVVAYP